MIASVRGILAAKTPDRVEVFVGGIGLKILIPLSTYHALPNPGETVTLSTSMQVKENAIDLIGFATESEREVFEMLIGVSGIGVKLALTVLSGLKLDDLLHSIISEDKTVLSSISGIGPKTAGRLILELKDKVIKVAASTGIGEKQKLAQVEEAILALEALGYSRYEAKVAVERAIKEIGTKHGSEVIIREALKTTVS